MKNNSDELYDKFKNLDFSNAKPVAQTPHLAKLQEATGGKSRITMRVDSDIIAIFKARAEMTGSNYQTMINDALRQFILGYTLTDVIRDTIRDTLNARLVKTKSGSTHKKVA